MTLIRSTFLVFLDTGTFFEVLYVCARAFASLVH